MLHSVAHTPGNRTRRRMDDRPWGVTVSHVQQRRQGDITARSFGRQKFASVLVTRGPWEKTVRHGWEERLEP